MRMLRKTVLAAAAVAVFASMGVLVGGVSVAFGAPVYSNACSSLGWPGFCTAGEFVEPLGVAVDNSSGVTAGDVYVVMYTPTPEVVQFKGGGERTGLAPVTGPAGRELQLPLFVAVDNATGDFYVDDFLGGVIDKFKPDGSLEESFGTNGQVGGFAEPTGVAVQQSTGDLFVAERGGDEVKEYSPAGALLGSFPVLPDPLDSVAADSAGDVFVDQEGGPVVEYPAGKRSEPVTIVAGGANAVAVDESTSKVFVAQNGGQELAELEPGGTLIEAFGGGDLGGQGSFGIGVNETTHMVYESNRSEGLGGIYTLGSPRFALTIEKAGAGSGEVVSAPVGVVCGAHCVGRFEEGQKVVLKAMAGVGSVFARWEGCEAEPGGECEVTMSAAKTIVAVFTSAPVIEAQSSTAVTQTTATLTGTVNPKGETPSTCEFRYALEESLLGSSVVECAPRAEELGSGDTGVEVAANLNGLLPNTAYYYRLSASNHTGQGEGATVQHLLTLPNPPVVQTGEASEVAPYSATISATVNPGSTGHAAQDDATYYFQYSSAESPSNQTPLVPADAGEGTSPVVVHAKLEELEPGTIYHYRILASNNNDKTPQVVTGETHTFTTVPTPPVLFGVGTGQVTQTSALIAATLQTQGLPTRWELQLATNPATLQYQIAGNTTSPEGEPLTIELEHLQPNTTYYYRLIATNPDGTTETTTATFTTLPGPAPTPIAISLTSGYPILGVPPNIFPAEARITSTTLPKKTAAKCPKGHRRTKKGRCVKTKPKRAGRSRKKG